MVDGDGRGVLRVAADGRRSVLWAAPGDEFENLASTVAATDDGTLVISTYAPPQLLARSLVGSVRVLRSPFFPGAQLVGEPDGSVLAATGDADAIVVSPGEATLAEPLVWRIAPDGSASVIAGKKTSPQGFDGDGDAPLEVDTGAGSVSRAIDDGLLIAGYTGVRYVAPDNPATLAVAITRPTLTSPRRPRITFATTRPATVEITIRHHDDRVASGRLHVGAGDGGWRLERPLAPGAYEVDVVARDGDGRVATDRQTIFLGGRLDDEQALQAANLVIDDLNARTRGGRVPGLRGCRRVTPRRVDCPNESFGVCQSVVSVQLHRDGLPYLRHYRVALTRHCRFRTHPRWAGPAVAARPL
jgi:hypothetical protein